LALEGSVHVGRGLFAHQEREGWGSHVGRAKGVVCPSVEGGAKIGWGTTLAIIATEPTQQH
jgi:hypothetical protein